MLITDDNSNTESAIPFLNTGYFIKFLIVLISRSAVDGVLSVNPEYICIFLLFGKF